MSKAVWNFSFKLKKGVSQEDFIQATKRLHDEVSLKQMGLFLENNICKGILVERLFRHL